MRCEACGHTYPLTLQMIELNVEHGRYSTLVDVTHTCPKCGNEAFRLIDEGDWFSAHDLPKDDACDESETRNDGVRHAA